MGAEASKEQAFDAVDEHGVRKRGSARRNGRRESRYAITIEEPKSADESVYHVKESVSDNHALLSSPPPKRAHRRTRSASPSSDHLEVEKKPLRGRRQSVVLISETAVETQVENRNLVNQYELVKSLGEGSSGQVTLARSMITDELFAIKIIHRSSRLKDTLNMDMLPHSAEKQKKMLREVAILKKLDHPNIVSLVEVIDDPDLDRVFLVMEYVANGCIMDINDPQPIAEAHARHYFHDILLGLEYVHYNGIAHGDLKPENLLLTESDHVKISDFGVSFLVSESRSRKKSAMGTPLFTAPEVLQSMSMLRHKSRPDGDLSRGSPSRSSRRKSIQGVHGSRESNGSDPVESGSTEAFNPQMVDIWALGVTLYMLVTGECPFVASNIFLAYELIREAPVEFPKGVKISKSLKQLISSMLEKDPDDRITIHALLNHPWVTEKGKFNLVNQASQSISVSQADIDGAVNRLSTFARKAKTIAKRVRKSISSRRRSIGAALSELTSHRSNSMSGDSSGLSPIPHPP